MLRQISGNILIVLIKLYQICLSPFFGPCCRFYPSCSDYMVTAIKKYGPGKGAALGIMRLLRCQPLHPGGYDPVK